MELVVLQSILQVNVYSDRMGGVRSSRSLRSRTGAMCCIVDYYIVPRRPSDPVHCTVVSSTDYSHRLRIARDTNYIATHNEPLLEQTAKPSRKAAEREKEAEGGGV